MSKKKLEEIQNVTAIEQNEFIRVEMSLDEFKKLKQKVQIEKGNKSPKRKGE